MPCHSVPTSPAMSRSSHHKSQPVTPQRLPLQRPGHRYSSSQSFYKSPVTPNSPYTPLSLRSFTSSASSTLTTPDHDGTMGNLGFSPDVASPTSGADGRDHSLADIAENWRSRASENGIKVSSMTDDSHFGDDEGMRHTMFESDLASDKTHTASDRTISDIANDSGFISAEEAALLAPSLITNNQRHPGFTPLNRPRAQSHLPSPTNRPFASPSNTRSSARHLTQPTSPLASRRPNQNTNVASTPPPNRALARQLKLKGSLTDPAHTRRREAFGPVWSPAQHNANMNQTFTLGLNQDTSFNLFDIDENDFENDFDYAHDQDLVDDSLMEQRYRSKHNNFDNSMNTFGYPGYTLPLLPSYGQQQQFFSNSQAPFSDPFHGNALGSITESVEHFFHTQQHFSDPNIHGRHGQSEFPPPIQPWGVASKLAIPAPSINAHDAYMGGPAWVPIPSPPSVLPAKAAPLPKPSAKATEPKKNPSQASGCSVCLASSPRTLAILVPCGHPLCSGCLTSALNIVGEKDMECAVCRGKVADFKLVSGSTTRVDAPVPAPAPAPVPVPVPTPASANGQHELGGKRPEDDTGRSFMDPLFSSPESGGAGRVHALESAFEFGLGLEHARASTPKREEHTDAPQTLENTGDNKQARERGRRKGKSDDNVVLRIDNVPWDITPPQIHKWLQQPLERVHVLLDKRGKTMSHAYVEVSDVAVAGRILRGEAQGELVNGKPRERGSVLGKGRRARGVTVTRSGQEELMADSDVSQLSVVMSAPPTSVGQLLFPTWRGSFDGSRPSLAGLSNDQVIGALEGGLISENEVVGLLHLIKEPDSHFLKAPSLPFHSLISILSKFPSDVDSRVFWSTSVRDTLYAAVQMLFSRVNSKSHTGDNIEYSIDLVSELVNTSLRCHAFTAQQLNKFAEFLESCPPPITSLVVDVGSGTGTIARSELRTPESRDAYGRVSNISNARVEGDTPYTPSSAGEGEDRQALAELAREFGVEAQLVQALAHRLSGLC
ncbi:hypothetical protein DXG01_007547 [Tephrocybe rancida]|nr:hypothetical protein DXG01_007547 [Tephrocybe rancida]